MDGSITFLHKIKVFQLNYPSKFDAEDERGDFEGDWARFGRFWQGLGELGRVLGEFEKSLRIVTMGQEMNWNSVLEVR
jgi:hypothetical protein